MAISHLIKEPTFFSKFKITEENASAFYADDDAMADFIVNGDIMIFDTSKTVPRNGKIFAIELQGRMLVRQLWIEADGGWWLEGRNPDKDTYPDLRFSTSEQAGIKLFGEFIYRQGG